MNKFTIAVDSPTNSCFPGQILSGRINVEVKSSVNVKEIFIAFKGKGHCEWSEGSGDHSRNYSSHEQYIKSHQSLYGKEQSDQNNSELQAGSHSFPFAFPIPSDIVLPPSFDDGNNYVRYKLKATIVRPWSINKQAIHVVNMVCPLDLNKIRRDGALMRPGEGKGRKTLCCLCCKSDPINAYVRTDRQGYVPGDTIVFNAEIENRSGRQIKYTKAQLIMKVLLICGTNYSEFVKKFGKIVHGPISAGGSDVYRNERLTIPPLPPSSLPGCSIIDVGYFLSIVVNPAGPALRKRIDAEIIIGSVPLHAAAAKLGVILPPLQGRSGFFDHTVLAAIRKGFPAIFYIHCVAKHHFDAVN